MSDPTFPPRLIPERSFPAYAFVPGLFPHPIRDPDGHSFGQPAQPPVAIVPDAWDACPPYLYGIDLFNHGYYWEAHEFWEGLWHAADRSGAVGDFLKGLIQMTAAGVKIRQRMPRGVASLGRGAADLLQKVRAGHARFLGLELDELLAFSRDLAERPERPATPGLLVERVLDLVLRPS